MTSSTLRDDILNHRCPICGTTMEKRPARTASTFRSVVSLLLIVAATVLALVRAGDRHWSEAAFLMTLAIFVVVTEA